MAQMLADEYEDPVLVASARVLTHKLQVVASHHQGAFSQMLIDDMEQTVFDHRSDFRRESGKRFPPMSVFVLPSYHFVSFERTDLDDSQIRGKMVMIARAFAERGIRLEEIEFAAAVVRTWPRYKPPIEELRHDPKTMRV